MNEYQVKFESLSKYVDVVQRDEEEKNKLFVNGLNPHICRLTVGLDLLNFRMAENKAIWSKLEAEDFKAIREKKMEPSGT